MRMKILYSILISCVCNLKIGAQQNNSIALALDSASIIQLADPAIFNDGKQYYLYGTVEGNSGNGFLVYTSNDLHNWKLSEENNGYALHKSNAFGTAGFWAPQVFEWQNKFYMAYVANEQIGIATSKSPLGPFIIENKQPLAAPVKQIDPFVFIDDDGKKYLYHVRLTGGNKIFVAQMKDDFSAILPQTLNECIVATESWENTANAKWPVAEGPTVQKHKGVYYLFYTANDFRNPDYAVGYATSSHPLGPWKKWEGNPIMSRKMLGINGTGHGDFINGQTKLQYVFHTHQNNSKVGPRRTAIVEMGWKGRGKTQQVVVDRNAFRYLYKQ